MNHNLMGVVHDSSGLCFSWCLLFSIVNILLADINLKKLFLIFDSDKAFFAFEGSIG